MFIWLIFVFFSADSLASRIIDGGVRILLTADGVWRGNKLIHLLEVADKAMEITKKEVSWNGLVSFISGTKLQFVFCISGP